MRRQKFIKNLIELWSEELLLTRNMVVRLSATLSYSEAERCVNKVKWLMSTLEFLNNELWKTIWKEEEKSQ